MVKIGNIVLVDYKNDYEQIFSGERIVNDIKEIKNLLGGLEKYGLDEATLQKAFDDTAKQLKTKTTVKESKAEALSEEDFLLLKSVVCPICDNVFSSMAVKSGRARRMQPDFDLRPKFEAIDVNKYDVTSCRKCGYTALNKDFAHLTAGQMKLISEGVRKNFKLLDEGFSDKAPDYDTTIERYKLALYNSMVKRAKISEKSYICLKIAWLFRGKIELLIKESDLEAAKLAKIIEECKKEELKFYGNAYDGLIEARSKESFPICGMDTNTYEMLLAAMAFNLDKLDDASRFVSTLLVSRTVNSGIKNRAIDLKEMILERRKELGKE